MSEIDSRIARDTVTRLKIQMGELPEVPQEFVDFQSAPATGASGDPQESTSEQVRDASDPNRVAGEVVERQKREGVSLAGDNLKPGERKVLEPGARMGGGGRERISPNNPRANQASTSEQVRDRDERGAATPDLPAALASGGRAVAERVGRAATGEEGGGGTAMIAQKLGIEPGMVNRIADTLLEVASMPSAAFGESVKNALIQAGVDNDRAAQAGVAAELGGATLFQGLTGLKGIQALGGAGNRATRAVKAAKATEGVMGDVGGMDARLTQAAASGKFTPAVEGATQGSKFDPSAYATSKGSVYQGEWKGAPGGAHEFREDALTGGGNFTVKGELTQESFDAALAAHYKSWKVEPGAAPATKRVAAVTADPDGSVIVSSGDTVMNLSTDPDGALRVQTFDSEKASTGDLLRVVDGLVRHAEATGVETVRADVVNEKLAGVLKKLGVDTDAQTLSLVGEQGDQVMGREVEIPIAALKRGRPGRNVSVADQIATMTADSGGATFSMAEGRNLGGTPGKFAVAIAPERGEIIEGLASSQQIEQFIKRNQDLLAEPGANVGTWFNEGRTYLDISRAVDSQDEALALGQRFRQKAVSNLETFEDIPVPVPRTTGHHVYDNPSMPLRDADIGTAAAYDALPDFDANAVPAWDALALAVSKKFDDVVATGLRIERVTGQPYMTAEEMAADIRQGVMRVTTDNSDHPIWDIDTNWKFRAWHDYEHHYLHGNDFSLDGEWRAYQVASNSIADPMARKALLTEIYGQAASAVANGGVFPPQKVALLDDATEMAAKLPSIEDRLLTPQASGIEKALEAGSWTPPARYAIPAAMTTDVALAIGLPADPNDPSRAYVAAPLTTIAATLAAGKKLSTIQKNALVNKAAGLIWRGVKQADLAKTMQRDFGPGIAGQLEGVWEKGQAQFDKILTGLKLRKVEDIERFFKSGLKVAGEWEFPDWYGAGQEIVDVFGVAPVGPAGIPEAELVAKLIAATSPQTAVQSLGGKVGNVELAIEAYKMLKKGASEEEISRRFTEMKGLPSAHVPNVMRAWNGGELQGNKVQDFWKAIYVGALGKGDDTRAVIDSHMIGALVDPGSSRITLPSKTNPGGQVIQLTETKDLSDAEYQALSAFVTDFARLHDVSPREAQQAIWIGRKAEEGREVTGELVEPLMDTVARSWRERGVEDEAFAFFESKKALGFATIGLGIAEINRELNDADLAVEEYAAAAGLGGLLNPRAAKALAQVARALKRAAPSVEVSPSLLRTGQYMRPGAGTIQVGKKMMSIDWATMGHSVDNMHATLRKVKEVFDTEGVHAYSRGIVGDADEAKLAAHILEETGYDVALALNRAAGEGVNSTWVWATAALLRNGMKRLNELEGAVKTAGLNTPAGLLAEIDMVEHMELVGVLSRALDGGLEEAGRTLRAARYAKDVTDEPRLIFLRDRAERVEKGIAPRLSSAGTSTAVDATAGSVQDAGRAAGQATPPAGAATPPPEPPVRPGEVPTGLTGQLERAGQEGAGQAPSPFAKAPAAGGAQQPPATAAGAAPPTSAGSAANPLSNLRNLVTQASKFGPTAGPGGTTTSYQAMLQQPAVQQLLLNMRAMRAGYQQLPTLSRPSFIKAVASWGYDMVWEAFFSSMLSTIPGNIANVTGNGLMLGREVFTRYMAAAEPWNEYGFKAANAYTAGLFDSVAEGLIAAGKTMWTTRSQFGNNQKISARAMTGDRMAEVFKLAPGAVHSAAEAMHLSKGADLGNPVQQFFNALGLAANAGSRGMIGTDEFVKTLAFRASIAEQAVQDALRQGLQPGTFAYSRAVTAFKKSIPDDAAKIAQAHSQYVTFTRDLGHGAIGGLQQFLQHPAAKVFAPFFKVSVNIMDVNLESMTGLSMLQNKIRHDILAGGPAAEIAANKLAVGAMTMALGVYMYENGNLTGRIVNEKKLEKHLRDQKIKGDSFIFRGEDGIPWSFPLERFDPITGPLLMVADVMDTYYAETDQPLSTETLGAAAVAIALGGWHNWLDRPWMQGTQGFLEAVSAEDRKDVEKGLKALRRPLTSVASFPTGAAGGQIERFRYPIAPEAYDWVDQLYAKVPWGTVSFDAKTGHQRKNPYAWLGGEERTLYPKRKANGEPYIAHPWEGVAALTPLPLVKGEPDVVSKALLRNGVKVQPPARTIKGTGAPAGILPDPLGSLGSVELSPKHIDRLAVLQGNGIKLPASTFEPVLRGLGWEGDLPKGKLGMWDFLTTFVQTPGFKNLHGGPGSVQADILGNIMGGYRRAAENILIVEDKQLRDKYLDHLSDAAGNKFGPGVKQMIDEKLSGPEGRGRIDEMSSSPDLAKFLQGMTQ